MFASKRLKWLGRFTDGSDRQQETRVKAAMLALFKQIMDVDELTTEGMTGDWWAQALHNCAITCDEAPTVLTQTNGCYPR